MSNRQRLARLDNAITAFLSNRRSLGRRYRGEEWILRSLRRHFLESGVSDLNEETFDQWRKSFQHLHPNTRRGRELLVHQFCRHRRRGDSKCFVPNPLSFSRPRVHALPTIIEAHEVAKMLSIASKLPAHPLSPLLPHVVRLAVVLLYTAGLRRGEVARLRIDDIDMKSGVLRIRESKFHRSRWVPLSPSAVNELRRYLAVRRASAHGDCSAPLLFNGRPKPRCYSGPGLARHIEKLFDIANVRGSNGRRPRVHDLRHSFAQAALLRWYEAGEDVQVKLPKLSLYMGHVSIISTARYLRNMPAVIARANKCFECRYGDLVNGDVT